MGSNIFEIKTLNVRSLTTSDLKLCRKKLTTFLEEQPSIAIFQETNQNHSGLIQLQKQFRYELGGYQVLLHNHRLIQKRSMLILVHRTCPLALSSTEAIENDCIKLSMTYENTSFAIFCCYAPSDGRNTNFLHTVRRAQLDSTETHSAIVGDLNCTLDPMLDRQGYVQDHHWQCRAIITEWTESGDLQDAFRHHNPELQSYTWRQDMKGEKAGRIDYVLLSPGLINMMTECYHFHQPRPLTDHSSVTCRLKIEKASQGPGIFRATPGIQGNENYDMEIRHIIHNTLVENSSLPEEEKSSELRRGASILELERKRISSTITEWETEALAIQLSLQKTPEDILASGGDSTAPNLMEFTIHKLGSHTKIFQRNLKHSQDDSLTLTQVQTKSKR